MSNIAQDADGENLINLYIQQTSMVCPQLHDDDFSEKADCEEAWKYIEFLKMDVTNAVNTILQVNPKIFRNCSVAFYFDCKTVTPYFNNIG